MDYLTLVRKFTEQGVLRTPRIIRAFRKINRADFLPPDLKKEAGGDYALPLGSGQTISQPQVVALMLELLAPEAGDKILDVGAGSGWTSALLAFIVGRKKDGEAWAVERIPKLCALARKNLRKYGFLRKKAIKLIRTDATRPLTPNGYFDKIIAAASAEKLPDIWKKELKIGGRIVAPVKGSIWLLIKKSETEFESREFQGFVFVPLVEKLTNNN